MKNVRRLLAAALTLTMLGGVLAGCGDEGAPSRENSENSVQTEESSVETQMSSESQEPEQSKADAVPEKPYKGMHFVVMIRDDMESRYGKDANAEFQNTHYQTIYHALNEWCLENEATWEQFATQDVNALVAAVASGNGPDIYFHYGQFPLLPNLGLAQPITEYYDYLADKYGAQYLDVKEYKGEIYGVQLPFNGYGSLVYPRDVLEQYGIKTPREYFMEGTWTWDALRQVANELTKDLDGDGEYDMHGVDTNYIHRFEVPFQRVNEDGTLTSLLDTEKNRYFYQMLYEEHTLSQAFTHGNAGGKTQMAIQAQVVLTDPSTVVWEDEASGHIKEAVPLPAYEEGEAVSINLFDCMIPSSAQNLDASVSMLDYLLECSCEVAFPDRYDFVGLRGTTEESATYLAQAKAAYEERINKTKALPEYDPEYIDAITEYYADKAIWTDNTFSGINIDSKEFFKNPAADSVAALAPVHQQQCETYNKLYVY